MLRFLTKKSTPVISTPPDEFQDLPNPVGCENANEIQIVNETVKSIISAKNNKRGNYQKYDDDFKSKIAKYSQHHGDAAAVRNFAKHYPSLNESTVRTWRKKYLTLEKSFNGKDMIFCTGKRGRPLKLGDDIEIKVRSYVEQLAINGGIVNRAVVVAAAKGCIMAKDRTLLKEFGGNTTVDRKWAENFLHRHAYVRRKGTKAARKLPENFPKIKETFFERISSKVKQFQIPLSMIINWDQTGVNIVPVGEWTLAPKGSKQVSIFGLDDKRQITVIFAITMDGQFLSPQLLYAGKTAVCHPQFNFPAHWDVWHSENHWSTEQTMLRYIEKVIIPHAERCRRELHLKPDHKALAIFDVFKAHRCETVFKKLRENNIEFVFVPASCTSDLQPLDSDGGINDGFKKLMKEQFSMWYGELIAKELNDKGHLNSTKIDLRLSTLKPVHAQWMISCYEKLRSDVNVICLGWQKTGIEEVVESALAEVIEVNID